MIRTILISLSFLLPCAGFSQTGDIVQGTFSFPSDAPGWMSTGLTVKKGDVVLFEVTGRVSLGIFAGYADGAGTSNPFLTIYSRFQEIPHGALICGNSDERVVAETKADLVKYNTLNLPYTGLDFLLDRFIGNIFISKADQEIQFIMNDADYANNVGEFRLSVKIYKNVQAAGIDYLSVSDCMNLKPQVNDVIIYRTDAGAIIHSGIVTKVDQQGKVVEIESKFQTGGRYKTTPEQTTYGKNWEIYHTDRAGGDGRNLLRKSTVLGVYVTDQGNEIKTWVFYIEQFFIVNFMDFSDKEALTHLYLTKFYYLVILFDPGIGEGRLQEMKDFGYNCHGYTFTGGDGWINDGWPVQRILHDNGYCRVFVNMNK